DLLRLAADRRTKDFCVPHGAISEPSGRAGGQLAPLLFGLPAMEAAEALPRALPQPHIRHGSAASFSFAPRRSLTSLDPAATQNEIAIIEDSRLARSDRSLPFIEMYLDALRISAGHKCGW